MNATAEGTKPQGPFGRSLSYIISLLGVVVAAPAIINIIQRILTGNIKANISRFLEFYQHLILPIFSPLDRFYLWSNIDPDLKLYILANATIVSVQIRAVAMVSDVRYVIMPATFVAMQFFTYCLDTDFFSRTPSIPSPLNVILSFAFSTLLNIATEIVINKNATESSKYALRTLQLGGALIIGSILFYIVNAGMLG